MENSTLKRILYGSHCAFGSERCISHVDSDLYLASESKTGPGDPDTPCIRPVPPALDRPVRCFGEVSQRCVSGPGMRAGRAVRTRSSDSTHSLHTAGLKTQPIRSCTNLGYISGSQPGGWGQQRGPTILKVKVCEKGVLRLHRGTQRTSQEP